MLQDSLATRYSPAFISWEGELDSIKELIPETSTMSSLYTAGSAYLFNEESVMLEFI